MSESDRNSQERFSLKRWSSRKLEAARATPSPAAAPASIADAPASASPSTSIAAAPVAQPVATAPLPPVESLTFESDFQAFLGPKVAEPLKRQALKKLFSDPRFNVMDGLDVYIDDYSKPSPLEPELVSQLLHARFTLDPPATRVNAQGYVEDVPPEEIADAAAENATPAAEGSTDASRTTDASTATHASATTDAVATADAVAATDAVTTTDDVRLPASPCGRALRVT